MLLGGVNPARSNAFTLAETLITLGIIGVVSAITLPSLIQKHQKLVSSTRMKETYTQLLLAVKTAQSEYGDIATWNDANLIGLEWNEANESLVVDNFDKYFLPYLKVTSASKNAQLKHIGYKTPITKQDGTIVCQLYNNFYVIKLVNGVVLLVGVTGNGTTRILGGMHIYIDINGVSGQNRVGRDVFGLIFSPTNPKIFVGATSQDGALKQLCKDGTAVMCTELLMRKNWVIDDDYPW
jgi:type II secretory pathway pseudopilin PulG